MNERRNKTQAAAAERPPETPGPTVTEGAAGRLTAWLAGDGGLTVACFLTVFSVYLLTLAPTITAGDAGELVSAAYTLGVCHPPGYPLWCLYAFPFARMGGPADAAYAVNLSSALMGALTCALLFRLARSQGVGRAAAFAGALCLGFSAELWAWSVVAKFYALNAFLVVLLLSIMLRWHRTRERRLLLWGPFVFGLSLCNHHTISLFGPVFSAFVLLVDRSVVRDRRFTAQVFGVFLLGLLPYFYLPLAASFDPYMNWGDPQTPGAFLTHITRGQYQFELTKYPRTVTSVLGQLGAVTGRWVEQFTPWLFPLVLIGALRHRARCRAAFRLCLAMLLTVLFGYVLLINFNLDRQELEGMRCFFIPSHILLALWLAFGLQTAGTALRVALRRVLRPAAESVPESAGRELRVHPFPTAAIAAAVAAACLLPLSAHWRANDQSRNWHAYDHAENILKTLPSHAMLFPSGDHNTFPLLYLQAVEGRRRDVLIADKYGYIEPKLYRAMPDPPPPHGGERRRLENWLIRHENRPTFYTVKRGTEDLDGFVCRPVGLLYRLAGANEPLDIHSPWAQYRYRNLEDGPDAPREYGDDSILSDFHFFRGLYHFERRDPAAALADFRTSERHGREVKELYNNLASALAEQGYVGLAEQYYRRALRTEPRYLAARQNLVRLQRSDGRLEDAGRELEDGIRYNPQSFFLYGELGFVRLRQNRREEARALWQKSLELQPGQKQLLDELAKLDGRPTAPAAPTVAVATASAVGAAKPGAAAGRADAVAGSKSSGPDTKAAPTGGLGRLEVGEPAWELGDVLANTLHEHEFRLNNTGTGPLAIAAAEADCGCTTALLSGKTIAAGQSGTLKVRYDSGKDLGGQKKHIRIRSDDPRQPMLTLTLQANVVAAVRVRPETLVLGTVAAGTRIRKSLTLAPGPGVATDIEDVTSSSERLQVAPWTNASRTMDLELRAGQSTGRVQEQVTIRFRTPAGLTLTVPVVADIVGPVDYAPKAVYLGLLARSGAIHSEVRLTPKAGKIPEVRVAACTPDFVAAGRPAPGSDGRVTVSLTGRAPDRTGPFSGTLTLEIGGADPVSIQIPITGEVE